MIVVVLSVAYIQSLKKGIHSPLEGQTAVVAVELPQNPTPTRVKVTAYCPCPKCCGEYSDGITASGYIIQPDNKFCAADPIIPFGKVLDIPGYGIVPVLDRGGKIKGNKIDVFYSTHEEALIWGNQELEIFCWVEGE